MEPQKSGTDQTGDRWIGRGGHPNKCNCTQSVVHNLWKSAKLYHIHWALGEKECNCTFYLPLVSTTHGATHFHMLPVPCDCKDWLKQYLYVLVLVKSLTAWGEPSDTKGSIATLVKSWQLPVHCWSTGEQTAFKYGAIHLSQGVKRSYSNSRANVHFKHRLSLANPPWPSAMMCHQKICELPCLCCFKFLSLKSFTFLKYQLVIKVLMNHRGCTRAPGPVLGMRYR